MNPHYHAACTLLCSFFRFSRLSRSKNHFANQHDIHAIEITRERMWNSICD
jgi:hypothetical protein